MHSACATYCHLWPVRVYHTFPQYLTNGTIFRRRLMNIKRMFWFPLQGSFFLPFLILRKLSKILSQTESGLHIKYQLLLLDFNQNSIFLTDFHKILKYQMSRIFIPWEQSRSTWMDRRIEWYRVWAPFLQARCTQALKQALCAMERRILRQDEANIHFFFLQFGDPIKRNLCTQGRCWISVIICPSINVSVVGSGTGKVCLYGRI